MKDQFPTKIDVLWGIMIVCAVPILAVVAFRSSSGGSASILLITVLLFQGLSMLMLRRSTAQARRHAAEYDYNLCTKCSHPLPDEPNTPPPPTAGAVEGYRPRPWWTCPECGRSHAEGEAQEHWRRIYKAPHTRD